MLPNYYSLEKLAQDRQRDLLREAAADRLSQEASGSIPRPNRLRLLAGVGTPVFISLVVLLLLTFIG